MQYLPIPEGLTETKLRAGVRLGNPSNPFSRLRDPVGSQALALPLCGPPLGLLAAKIEAAELEAQRYIRRLANLEIRRQSARSY